MTNIAFAYLAFHSDIFRMSRTKSLLSNVTLLLTGEKKQVILGCIS